jgi:stage II sporulation protein D
VRRSLSTILKRRFHGAPRAACGALLVIVVAAAGGCAGAGLSVGGGGAGGAAAPPDGIEADAAVPGAGPGYSEAAEWFFDQAPLMRVGLAHGVREASVSGRGGFAVSVYSSDTRRWSASSGSTWRFRAEPDGMEGRGSGESFAIGEGTIRVSPDAGSFLVFGDVAYRGEMELFSSGPGSLAVVNVVDLESYLRGVVPKEIGPRPESEIEAVKAQAVAARTYAVAASGRRALGDFDVYATVEDQVYAGVDGENAVCDRAILETAGIFMSYKGEPINAYFHANCGGMTEAREEVWGFERVPYLTQVWDTSSGDRFDDAFCSGGTNFAWTETWSGSEIASLITEHLPSVASTPVKRPIGDVSDISVSARTPSGRVRWLEVETTSGTYRVFGDSVRWLLRRPGSGRILRSAWFELDVQSRGGRVTRVTAEGRGYGHGVGMCQHGAMEMARRGHTYRSILSHYYRGASLTRAYGAGPETP